jgi:hypothetical protein
MDAHLGSAATNSCFDRKYFLKVFLGSQPWFSFEKHQIGSRKILTPAPDFSIFPIMRQASIP